MLLWAPVFSCRRRLNNSAAERFIKSLLKGGEGNRSQSIMICPALCISCCIHRRTKPKRSNGQASFLCLCTLGAASVVALISSHPFLSTFTTYKRFISHKKDSARPSFCSSVALQPTKWLPTPTRRHSSTSQLRTSPPALELSGPKLTWNHLRVS